MAVQVFKNAFVRIGTSATPTTDYHRFVRSVTMNYRQEILDKTAMGSSGRKRTFGLNDVSVTIEFNQDYSTTATSTGSVDGWIANKIGVESSNCWISIRATTASTGPSNPQYQGRFILESYNPVSGNVADLGIVTANFVSAGKIQRKTA